MFRHVVIGEQGYRSARHRNAATKEIGYHQRVSKCEDELLNIVFTFRQGSNERDSFPTKQPTPESAANQPGVQANRLPRKADSPRLPANRGWLGSCHCA